MSDRCHPYGFRKLTQRFLHRYRSYGTQEKSVILEVVFLSDVLFSVSKRCEVNTLFILDKKWDVNFLSLVP